MKDKRIWLVILGILVIGIMVTCYTRSVVKKQAGSASFAEERSTETALGLLEKQMEDAVGKDGIGAVQEQGRLADQRETETEEKREETAADLFMDSGQRPDQAQADAAVPETEEKKAETGEPAAISESGPAMARAAVPGGGREATDPQADSLCEGGIYKQRLNDLDAQIQKMREQERDPNIYSIKTSAETEVKMWDRELNAVYNALLGILPQDDAEELAKEQKEWLRNRETAAGQSGKAEGAGSISYAASLVDLTRDRAYELADRYEREVCGSQDFEKESSTEVLP